VRWGARRALSRRRVWSSASAVRRSPRATLPMPAGAGNTAGAAAVQVTIEWASVRTSDEHEGAWHDLRTGDQRLLDSLRQPADPLVAEMEAYAAENGVPIAPRETAALLGMLARAAGARFVLEVGLAIGYSALHIARALPDYGKVVSLESDMHMASLARTYLSRDPAGARVEILLGDAHETLPGLREIFDVIFIDADKTGYPGVSRSGARAPAQDRAGRDRQPPHGRSSGRGTGRRPLVASVGRCGARAQPAPGRRSRARLRAAAARRRRGARAAPAAGLEHPAAGGAARGWAARPATGRLPGSARRQPRRRPREDQ